MAFELPDLPYAHDALAEFGMSAETLEYHHDLHHNAYVVNGNNLIAGTEWEDKSLEDIIIGTYDAKAVAQNGIFNNASQHWNHMKFWEMMGQSGPACRPSLNLHLSSHLVLSMHSRINLKRLAPRSLDLAGAGLSKTAMVAWL